MKRKFTAVLVLGISFLISCTNKQEEIKLQHQDITEMVFASGALEADDQYNLTAQTDGYLIEMNLEEGTIVRKEQVLAVIDNDQNIINSKSAVELHRFASENAKSSAPALQEVEAAIEAAEVKVKLDQQQLERYKRLYESNSISRIEYDNANLMLTNSESVLNALKQKYRNQQIIAREQEVIRQYTSKTGKVLEKQNRITSIRPGKVYMKKKQLGDYVRKGDVIAVIGNPDSIFARLNVDETGMAKLKIGQTVFIKLNTHVDEVYKAFVKQILPAFDEASRTFIVKAYFEKTPEFNITGTQLEANIVIRTKKNVLVIPRVYMNYDHKVMLKTDRKIVKVVPGIVSGEWVEIKKGLNAGQTIIKEAP
ncbi:efflux RND transporter periplasmic adaptor subunit [Flavobacterium procerum]|uniref:Efflux RND transporter periplasmic adaptor subunit n=1 Tax=Flavobacterium procerum TaxID=1455569 RepID=A0ABV6BUX7_9FLAO